MTAARVWVTPEAETCQCSEAYVPTEGGARRLEAALLHHCEYIRRRNALIPQAQKLAKRASHGGYGYGVAFLEAMQKLVAEARGGGLM